MKYFTSLSCLLLTAAALLFAGCSSAPEGTTIFGDPCQPISAKRTHELIVYSRLAIRKNAKKYNFTPEEMRIVNKTYPQLMPKYRGDCFGTFLILWNTPQRVIGMRYENDLNAALPSCALVITTSDGDYKGVKPDKTLRGR